MEQERRDDDGDGGTTTLLDRCETILEKCLLQENDVDNGDGGHRCHYADEEEKRICMKMAQEELTEEEQELAARSSYVYWYWSTNTPPTETVAAATTDGKGKSGGDDDDDEFHDCVEDDEEEGGGGGAAGKRGRYRLCMSAREIRRHYIGEDRDYDKALAAVKDACRYRSSKGGTVGGSEGHSNRDEDDEDYDYDRDHHRRKKQHVDGRDIGLVRSCFDPAVRDGDVDGAGEGRGKTYRDLIRDDLSNQLMVTRGYDTENRCAVMWRMNRTDRRIDPLGYELAQLYVLERALAATEIESDGEVNKISVVLDVNGYKSKFSPPAAVLKNAMMALQRNYPERLNKFYVLDAPLWARALYKVLSRFMARDTKSKIQLVSGDKKRKQLEEQFFGSSSDIGTPGHGGKPMSDVDLNRFLDDIPFHGRYTNAEEKA